MTLQEFGQDVIRHRAALEGDIDMPRNSGKRRSASKRALLEEIEATGKIG